MQTTPRHRRPPILLTGLLALAALALAACAGVVPTGPGTGSEVVGFIDFGEEATATIAGDDCCAIWHAYRVTVPPGTAGITIRMDANADLDMAAKFGSPIDSYQDKPFGDWDYRDITLNEFAEFVITDPDAGTWYIDVFNALGAGNSGTYTLVVTEQ